MLNRLGFSEEWARALMDALVVSVKPVGPTKASVLRATGMSFNELDVFLNANQIEQFGSRMDAGAMPVLEEWYVGKMQKYVRNVLASSLTAGSDDDILFCQFCEKYLKNGITEIKSWEDIDVDQLLIDFEEECYTSYPCISNSEHLGGLLNSIPRSYLFHIGVKKPIKHRIFPITVIVSFILSNRYHIFTTEGDAYADKTNILAEKQLCEWYNPPRHSIQYGLAP